MASPRPLDDAQNRQASNDHEPDYRFTLANERTFLAWIRTALALLAGSVAIVQLAPHFMILDARKLLGELLAATSIVIVIYSGWRWYAVQQAMRQDSPLPRSLAIWLLTGAIVVVGILVVLLVAASGIGN